MGLDQDGPQLQAGRDGLELARQRVGGWRDADSEAPCLQAEPGGCWWCPQGC